MTPTQILNQGPRVGGREQGGGARSMQQKPRTGRRWLKEGCDKGFNFIHVATINLNLKDFFLFVMDFAKLICHFSLIVFFSCIFSGIYMFICQIIH